MRTLFVTWDGPGPNYMESLFLPIYDEIQKSADVQFDVLQYCWDSDDRSASIATAAERMSIPYVAGHVWRWPTLPATAMMILKGALDIISYVRRHDVQVLMPRSIIPGAMCLLAIKFLPAVKLLYDADGLMADERVDFGNWKPTGLMYRAFLKMELATIRRADAVVTRTRNAKRILVERSGLAETADKMSVGSNGKDAEQFRPVTTTERTAIRKSINVNPDAPLVIYCGSVGPQYYPAEMLALFGHILKLRPDACFIALTNEPDRFREHLADHKFNNAQVQCMRVEPDLVPRYLAAADLGLALRKPSYSQKAVAPIKVGEYLLSGLPVVSTRGIGDLDDQLDSDVGMFYEIDCDDSAQQIADWFTDQVLSDRDAFCHNCRKRGLQFFGFDISVQSYLTAFQILGSAGNDEIT